MTSATEELLPCPFCGDEAEVVEADYGMYKTGYAVYCSKCGLKLGVTGRLGQAYEWWPIFHTEAQAIEAWNTRAQGTCEVEGYDDGVDEGMDGEWYAYAPPTWYLSCGHETYGSERPCYCSTCGRKVEG